MRTPPPRPAALTRSSRLDRSDWLVGAALSAPLLFLLVVTAMTWRSERHMTEVTARVVHDYSAIAVWQYARKTSQLLHDETMHALSEQPGAHMRSGSRMPLVSPSALLARRDSPSPPFLSLATHTFTYSGTSRQLLMAGAHSTPGMSSMLRRNVRTVASESRLGNEPHHVLFDSSDGTSYAIALSLMRHAGDSTPDAVGLVIPSAGLAPLFSSVVATADLLPAVQGRRALDTADVAIRLTRANGEVVYSTGFPIGSTAATDTSGLQGSSLLATLDLSPALAQELLVGGAPASQLPSLLAMLLVSGVFAAAGLAQHRRSRALSRARARFVANVSHELRTPLAQISMFAETLQLERERSPAERRQFAGIIFAEARRLTTLVENVLRMSRSEHVDHRLRRRMQYLRDILITATRTFAPLADSAGVVIEVDAPKDLAAAVDSAAFQQILLNLLDNAVKHGGREGRVRLSARQQGNEAHVMIDDQGPGIPIGERESVFEPFTQLEGRSVAGAGIGLAIVRDLVQAHAGRVWIEQSPLGGARVCIAVALYREVPAVPDDPREHAVR